MTDENDKPGEESQDAESSGPVAGERLAEARREQQITVLEIAKELHLDEYKVRALECNDFDVIGAPVFAKGHLRKYAQLMKVSEADVMADYYLLDRSAGAPPVIATRPRQRKIIAIGPWIAVVVAIIAAATAYWWFTSREAAPERPITGEVAPLPSTNTDVVTELEEASTDDSIVVLDEPVESSQALPELLPEDDLLPPIDDLQTRLSITYSGDCWTEISDASGRRMFFDLGKAGRTVNLSGEAPFNVLFGDASNVSILIDGVAFDLPEADRRGRTARLTISGS